MVLPRLAAPAPRADEDPGPAKRPAVLSPRAVYRDPAGTVLAHPGLLELIPPGALLTTHTHPAALLTRRPTPGSPDHQTHLPFQRHKAKRSWKIRASRKIQGIIVP